jgi:hypothetical protein
MCVFCGCVYNTGRPALALIALEDGKDALYSSHLVERGRHSLLERRYNEHVDQFLVVVGVKEMMSSQCAQCFVLLRGRRGTLTCLLSSIAVCSTCP